MQSNKSGKLIEITEKPSFDFIVNAGLYLINKKILKLIPNRSFDVPQLIQSAKKKNSFSIFY